MSITNDLFASKVELEKYYKLENKTLRSHLIEVSVREQLQASRLFMAIGNELIPTMAVRIGVYKKSKIPINWFGDVFCNNRNIIIRLSEDVNSYSAKARNGINKLLTEHLQFDQMSLSKLHTVFKKSSAG